MNKKNIWNIYFIFTVLWESFLVLMIKPMTSTYHFVPFVLFFFASGLKENFKLIFHLIKKYYYLVILLFIWIIYFGIFSVSSRILLFFVLCVLSGYFVSKYGNIEIAARYAIMILTPIIIISIILHILQINPLLGRFPAANVFANFTLSRLASIFAHPIPAACVLGMYSFICLFYIENIWVKSLLCLLGIISLFLTGSRSTILAYVISMVIYFVIYCARYLSDFKSKINLKSTLLLIVVIIVGLLFLSKIPSVNIYVQQIMYRFNNINNEINNGFYRFIAWETMVNNVWPSNSWIIRLFGAGNQSCLAAMQTVGNEAIASSVFWAEGAGMQVGTVDSTYFSLLYDYGLLSLCLMLFGIIYVGYKMIVGNQEQTKIATILFAFQLSAISFDMQYWSSISFIALFFMGILLEMSVKQNLKRNSKSENLA